MKSIRLGKTELQVSELGFGGIPIIPLGFEDGAAMVRYAFDKGVNFFDTANMYGDSEKKMGEALEAVRDQVIIATKTTVRDAAGAVDHIELSLVNLRTDYLDLFQFHNIARDEELEAVLAPGGAMEAVKKAMAEGKVRHIGFSSHNIDTAIKVCRTGLFSTIQFPFNFIETDPLDELFKVARELDMGIIAMKPLGGGLLENAGLCFKYLQQHPDIVPIPGIASTEELDEIIALYDSPQPLNASDQAEIERIRADLGKDFCHRCRYCLPCEQEVQIADIMTFRSMAKRLAPPVALAIVKGPMESVDNCTDCEECLAKCPYNLAIPDVIREQRKMYDEMVAQYA
jgi:predicted aldo/keto reductase-like oxidoreductase